MITDNSDQSGPQSIQIPYDPAAWKSTAESTYTRYDEKELK